ncbi:unnamed protein product [Prorocentrum cordatum]|uniref:Purinergic receptor n=1 Tax=Prorocentrum cordatum TaxID=2364126 RepID=A0ABN9Y303_9DINO|nr:unnamed protein product [Polarella glacialis]|mmetsp:Transcript_82975/g.216567  ORF Transcript_82975/g.216567 Transcript_82975/m.216567 type:complete len:492 (-) Transcript_82975:215-1690(-)
MGEALRKCVACDWLGDSIFGVDVDRVFAYPTPKVVSIQDRTLGIVKYSLMLLIFCYVAVYQMAYMGEHFEMSAVEGISRQQWKHPTKNGCNPSHVDCVADFTPVTALPYCRQHSGGNTTSANTSCRYFDAYGLPVSMPKGVLMPTYIETYKQRVECPPGAEDCEMTYRYVNDEGQLENGTGKAVPISAAYVADVEDFTLLIDHSFRTVNGKMASQASHMEGSYRACRATSGTASWISGGALGVASQARHTECTTQPLPCVHPGCRRARGSFFALPRRIGTPHVSVVQSSLRHREQSVRPTQSLALDADSEQTMTDTATLAATSALLEPVAFSIEAGDVFSLRTLLAMAGETLDDADVQGEPLRRRGGALVVGIEYHNLRRWSLFSTQDPPEYTVSATLSSTDKFKHRYAYGEDQNGRMLKSLYGVYVVVEQSGQLAFFDITHSLLILTTALGLLVLANTLTDFLALYILPRKDEYYKCKYEETDDFCPAKS